MKDTDIRTKKPALVVVDMQRKYADSTPATMDAVPEINRASAIFRRSGRPVFLIRMNSKGHGVPEDLEDPDGFVDGLTVEVNDIIIDKAEMNAFCRTCLAEDIADSDSDSVVVCGVMARWCVISTYFGAFEHGLMPYLLKGGTASFMPEDVPHVEAICKVVGTDELEMVPSLAPVR